MNPTTKGGTKEKSKEGIHYYNEGGYRVFTAEYHRIRGYCCNNKCRHCCYKNNGTIDTKDKDSQ
jgi:hypothetical protein